MGILPGLNINGSLTLTENIADFVGLTMAYQVYKLSQREEPEKIDGFTGDQRFFLSFAQMWRQSQKDETLITQVLTNPHSPAKFRTNEAAPNVPEFYQAFPGVKPVDKLYKPPSKRHVIR
jgi:putative endopeptidase